MYGLLIESLTEHLRLSYGEQLWAEIRKGAELDTTDFSIQKVYPEQTLPRIVSSASKLLGISEQEIMEAVGVHFVNFVSRYGYDRMLSVLGRHMRDFLNGLDNLHEYMRFSYPKMRPPSFFCENEDKNGLTLHYRTRRRGYLYYTIGQIKAVGELFYHTPVTVEILDQEIDDNVLHVVMRLNFDNCGFDEDTVVILHEELFHPVQARVLFELFPFSIVFSESLEINVLGSSLHLIMADALGRKLNDIFTLVRPALEISWEKILSRTNNIFELMSIEPLHIDSGHGIASQQKSEEAFTNEPQERCLQLKGQMLFMAEWQSVIYLGTPVMPDLDAMVRTGLYINDLSMYDFSRDLMLAGTQQSVELRLALDQEQKKTKRLEESMKKLDEEMKRTDQLLYQMIPKEVANRLRNGETAVNTCEVFDSVTILFSDVVTFTEMCSRITPMEVVTLLNLMYSLFDNLTEKHDVYKVETIGDAYMVVAGAPQRVTDHAIRIADMALDMTQVITGLKDPSTNRNIRIRIGIHSGNVVAGVVGVKMPRYCLFGDAVNTTSRMESSSEPMKIQVSADTKARLPPIYKLEDRGTVSLKGKGRVKTYWLVGKDGYVPPTADDIMASVSTHYSPVMLGENILQRDSLAYSALSVYSTPSRPPTEASFKGDDIDTGQDETAISQELLQIPARNTTTVTKDVSRLLTPDFPMLASLPETPTMLETPVPPERPTPNADLEKVREKLIASEVSITPRVVIEEARQKSTASESTVAPTVIIEDSGQKLTSGTPEMQMVTPSSGNLLSVPQLRKRSQDGDVNFNVNSLNHQGSLFKDRNITNNSDVTRIPVAVNNNNNSNTNNANNNNNLNVTDNMQGKVEVPVVQCSFQCQSTSCQVQ